MADSILNKNTFQNLTVIVLAVVLLLTGFAGFRSGQTQAQADVVARDADQITAALNFFYADQDSFPNAIEFADSRVMSAYLNVWPAQEFVSSVCSQSFAYKRLVPNSFQFSACLPAASGGFKKGWNEETVTK